MPRCPDLTILVTMTDRQIKPITCTLPLVHVFGVIMIYASLEHARSVHPIATQPVQKQDCQEALIENTNYFSRTNY